MTSSMFNRGSDWHRWEPHIHAPGTALNDQFGGADGWDEWLTRVENASPKIEALSVTDYYLTDTYQKVIRYKAEGRLKDVKLIFPNIEVRLCKRIFPREWFYVLPEHVSQAVAAIRNGTLHELRYDPARQKIVRRS